MRMSCFPISRSHALWRQPGYASWLMAKISPHIIDLIIPARDEEDNIPPLLTALPKGLFRHVIVADNGSTDQTAQVARSFKARVVSEPYRGYGAACLAGLNFIEQESNPPDMVAFLDADLSDDPSQLVALCELISQNKADLVVGSRRRFAEAGSLTITQRFGNSLACSLILALTGKRFSDLGPMRVIRWESLLALQMKDRTWGWTVEMQYKAATKGLRTSELHVPYHRRRAGRSKISGSILGSVRAGTKILSTIGILWWQSHFRIQQR